MTANASVYAAEAYKQFGIESGMDILMEELLD